MKTVTRMIQTRGGLAAVHQSYLSVENPPMMRLVIEVVQGPMPSGAFEVSVAHYGEQNGDPMRDPEMTFLVMPDSTGPWFWWPLTFLHDYVGVYQQAATYDDRGLLIVQKRRLHQQLDSFARTWDSNIRRQGYANEVMLAPQKG